MTDWRGLLTKHRIQFVESGPSTARDNLYVHCPFCGSADQGHHMGISTRGRGWGCWRNARHRGRSDSRLLAALLRITQDKASTLLGERRTEMVDDEDLASLVQRTLEKPDLLVRRHVVKIPAEVRPLGGGRRGEQIFFDYLQTGRGYHQDDVAELARRYDLHFAMKGPFAYRLVLPVSDQDGLATLTGRSVVPDVDLRYLTLSHREDSPLVTKMELPVARGPITDYLLWEDRLLLDPPRTLVVCEGPFDAMRVDWAHVIESMHASLINVAATCLFGKVITSAQFDKLATLSDFSDEKFLLLDPDARFSVLETVDRLAPLGFKPIYLDERWEDPGDRKLPLSEIRHLVREEVRKY